MPDALRAALCVDGSAAYAVLDGSRVPNLEDSLHASGLRHVCPFRDGTPSDMRRVAPWLVRLDDGNACTRSLFTRGDAPCFSTSQDTTAVALPCQQGNLFFLGNPSGGSCAPLRRHVDAAIAHRPA